MLPPHFVILRSLLMAANVVFLDFASFASWSLCLCLLDRGNGAREVSWSAVLAECGCTGRVKRSTEGEMHSALLCSGDSDARRLRLAKEFNSRPVISVCTLSDWVAVPIASIRRWKKRATLDKAKEEVRIAVSRNLYTFDKSAMD